MYFILLILFISIFVSDDICELSAINKFFISTEKPGLLSTFIFFVSKVLRALVGTIVSRHLLRYFKASLSSKPKLSCNLSTVSDVNI